MRDAGCFRSGCAFGLRRVPERLYSNIHIISCLIRLHFPGDGRLHRQQCEGRALVSWRAKRFPIAASRSARLSRVRLPMICLSPWKSTHSKEFGSKHFPTGSHASQHRMSVPRCLFLYACNAVEAVKLSGVLRESSRTVRFLAFSRIILKSASAPNGSPGDRHFLFLFCFKIEQKT